MSSAYWVGVRIETAMSLVTWSPAIGMTAVWRIAPLANTARSVVPPPMSTRHTPSSFSSSVRTAKLEASCSRTTSSTTSPQRWMHFSMFCAALSAPVTMCTLASRRTPDMPIGSRMPSWPSTRNSCGSTCRIFWSAGMATALAASITCSTSPCVTSLSRTPTTPWEFRLRTWLPAMPANTEWISQPAMSSASSTARWMDCTVDSMLTTTPFFRPREGCEPRPMISIAPSEVSSPTSATTLEVPTSSPTTTVRSARLAIDPSLDCIPARGQPAGAAPADRETIGVAHVHVGDIGGALADHAQRHRQETRTALIDLLAADAHHHAVVQLQLPGAAGVEAQRGEAEPRLHHADLQGLEAPHDFRGAAVGPAQLRQLGRHETRIAGEAIAAHVDEVRFVPARDRLLLGNAHQQAPRPAALHRRRIDPGQHAERAAHLIEMHAQEPSAVQLLAHRLFDIERREVLELPLDLDVLDRLVAKQRQSGAAGQHCQQAGADQSEAPPRELRQLPALARALAASMVAAANQHGVRTRLVSSTRQASSSKSIPAARAAIGTRL